MLKEVGVGSWALELYYTRGLGIWEVFVCLMKWCWLYWNITSSSKNWFLKIPNPLHAYFGLSYPDVAFFVKEVCGKGQSNYKGTGEAY